MCIRDRASPPLPLTYFEYATLSALWLFHQELVDVAILEVGLGGRLDAVNIVDADVSIVAVSYTNPKLPTRDLGSVPGVAGTLNKNNERGNRYNDGKSTTTQDE